MKASPAGGLISKTRGLLALPWGRLGVYRQVGGYNFLLCSFPDIKEVL